MFVYILFTFNKRYREYLTMWDNVVKKERLSQNPP